MRVLLISAFLAGGLVASCAPVSDAPGSAARQCFLISQVRSFGDGDNDESIVVQAGSRGYVMEALGYCQDIDWANQVAIDPLIGESSLCVGDQADLIVRPLGGPVERCRVRVTRALTEAENEAL